MSKIERNYRPEINGLRAVAVLIVLFFHLGLSGFGGGYLGVDIFFVISGYLISRNILYDLELGQFSFKQFYTKRLLRLMPALIVTVLLTLIAGYFLFTAFFFQNLSESAFFASLSLSNFYFWNEAGYFNVGADLKPLLHTWSLAIEEQFYLIWPILLVGLWSLFKKHIWLILLLISAFSMGLCHFYYDTSSSAVFFLLPFRVFEFGLGALCIYLQKSIKPQDLVRNILFILALLIIGFSVYYFDRNSFMPSCLSLLPCMGAMLIILLDSTPLSSLILSNKVVELLGKASYSIYLVHWPLIVFYKNWAVDYTTVDAYLLAGGSIVLGLLMWRSVEQVFRYSKVRPIYVWIITLGLLGSLAAGSWFIKVNKGFPGRDPNPYTMTRVEMETERGKYWKEGKQVRYNNTDGSPATIIIGNSHAVDLIYALQNNGFGKGLHYLPTHHDCFNFGAQATIPSAREVCQLKWENNINDSHWTSVRAVYLHDDWKGENYKTLSRAINDIRKKTIAPIYVFGPKMVYSKYADIILGSINSINPDDINAYAQRFVVKAEREGLNSRLKAHFNQASYSEADVYYIDLLDLQAPYELISTKTAKLLYFDSGHFTKDGSKEMGEKLKVRYPDLF